HELLPEPGSPIASTTTPLEGRGASGGTGATLGAVRPRGVVTTAPGAGCIGSTGSSFTVAASAVGEPVRLRPRPPLPRPRRRLLASAPPTTGRGELTSDSIDGISMTDSGSGAAGAACLISTADSGWTGSVS